ncbi:hypothetical protein DN752_10325 [Echinicola strongylocentroti]|uniref:Porin n=1 Tax=Echinicola strongylocentroti TaxID=1795355 RepID=A0A2Z4IQW9_9BACT|nr:hypothetical protein [Echinicola strongylocentroti]AWW33129.1 hypothetical protein DN752_10325 [Echinicola strongylocentroti]
MSFCKSFLFFLLTFCTWLLMAHPQLSHAAPFRQDTTIENQPRFGIFKKDHGKHKATIENTVESHKEMNRDTSWVKVGGALRLNTIYAIYEGQTFPLGTNSRNEWTWDTWRINVDSYSDGLQFAFEYRFYPTFNTHFIKYGWIGYRFSEKYNLQLGITQVPFGLLTYASHSWWFQIPYYLGLEDDHQMGFNLTHNRANWTFNLAYFPLSEPRGTNDPAFGEYSTARYSYDVVPIDGNSNIERNQLNLRANYHLDDWKLGGSFQVMEIYNQQTTHSGNQLAAALHAEWSNVPWNFKTEIIYYGYNNVQDDDGRLLNSVQMGAYGFGTYDVASEAMVYVIGLAHDFPVDWGPISNVQVYNDYSLIQKFGEMPINGVLTPFQKTQQNVLGALITAGKIYTYVDAAMGYNHSWISDAFGGNSMGPGRGIDYQAPVSDDNPIDPDPGWNTRININIGYYF